MFSDDDWVWKAGLAVVGTIIVCGFVYALTHDNDDQPATSWSAPARPVPAPVVVQHDDDGSFMNGYLWGRMWGGGSTHHETTVHHVYHPAPTPAPVRVITVTKPAPAPAPAVRYTPVQPRVSAIKTVSSPARSMSVRSFSAGGRR